MKKRGQFTIIVIVGIFIVLGILAFIFLKPEEFQDSEVQETDPIRIFVDQCVESIAKEAVIQLGEHGGIVDPFNFSYSEDVLLELPIMPTESDGVSLFSRETFVPYWYYLESSNTCNECIFNSLRPEIEDIENQISMYVDYNIDTCLKNFADWQEIRNIESIGEPKTNTIISGGKVIVNMEYPIEATTVDATTKLSKFRAELDVDLENIYDTATDILFTFTDEDVKLLEKMGILLIGAYSMGNDPKLPPMFGGVDLTKRPYTASLPEADRELRLALMDHIPLLSVSGARDNIIPITNNNLTNSLSMAFVATIDDELLGLDLSNMFIDFIYFDDWPIHLEITGGAGSGQIIESEMIPLLGIGPFKLPIFIRNMDFVYDVAYPVVIELTDNSAFNDEGYVFRFAMEANIRNNDHNFSVPYDTVSFDTPGRTLICDQENRKSANVKVTAKDPNGRTVKDAIIKYRCGFETCYIGETNDLGVLDAPFPICAGGELFAEQDNYYGLSQALATSLDQKQSITMDMIEGIDMKAVVEKKMVQKYPGQTNIDEPTFVQTSVTEDLHIDERVYVTLERVDPPEFRASINFDGTLAPTDVKLIPGTYKLGGVLLRDFGPDKESLGWTIAEDEICTGSTCTTMDELTFDETIVLGGLEDYTIEITEDDLSKNEIKLFVSSIRMEDLIYHADMTGMSYYTEASQNHPTIFTPVFS